MNLRTRAAALGVLWIAACTVDSDDGATSLGGTTVPTVSASTTVGTTSPSTSVSSTASASETGDEETTEGGPDATTDPPEDSGGPNEQPADGLYSACESAVECFGATACVLVMGSLGYCSNNCTIASDCGPPPAGDATPACVTASVNAVEMLVCALDCSSGACPGGMECLPLGAAMVCV